MAAILDSAGKYADFVIVDAPPFLVADASILAAQVDGVHLVLRLANTQIDAALSSIE